MPDALLYCVADAHAITPAEHDPPAPDLGLYALTQHGKRVRNGAQVSVDVAEEGPLVCIFACIAGAAADPRDFYNVVSAVLEDAPALPFRFPTVLKNEALEPVVLALRGLLRANASTFAPLLAQSRDFLEIDVRIADAEAQAPKASGTAYLQGARDRARRMLETADELRGYMHGMFTDWKSRETGSEVRCAALVERRTVATFNQRIAAYPSTRGAQIIVSRPWAPTGFMAIPELTFPPERA